MPHSSSQSTDIEPKPVRLVVIGGVAGGATAAARARRVNEHAEITLVERGPYVSFANCGLPYFIAGEIEDRERLLLQTPDGFHRRYRVKALLHTEAVEIDRASNRVRVRGPEGETWLSYDRLILAQGGNPIIPPIPGGDAPHVFTLWTVPHMDRIHSFIEQHAPKTAVVIGGGFIGLEMAEAFAKRGVETTVVELQPTLMPPMDHEFGHQIANAFIENGVHVITGAGVTHIHGDEHEVQLADGRRVAAELVLFAVGVRPELELAKQAGLSIGASGALLVDNELRTSDQNIFAAGDMAEVEQFVSHRRVRVPLAGPANRQGRIAASNALGMHMPYDGALSTSVVKVFDATAAMTGLSDATARAAGFDVGVAIVHAGSHASYYPGARELSLKLVYEKPAGLLLGAQAFGHSGVEKRIDVLAMALRGRMTLHDLAAVDLAYAPPYSSANDPVNIAGFVGENDLSGFSPLISPQALRDELRSSAPPIVLDVRTTLEFESSHLADARNIPVDDLRDAIPDLDRDARLVIYCRAGYRGHLAMRILKEHGFTNLVNVTGGWVSLGLLGGLATATDPLA